MSTPGRIGVCFEHLPLVNNLPHCRTMDFKWFGNGCVTLPRLIAATIADVLTPWCCVNTHLKAQNQQTTNISAFIEVLGIS